jgi:hypothetical protein
MSAGMSRAVVLSMAAAHRERALAVWSIGRDEFEAVAHSSANRARERSATACGSPGVGKERTRHE